MRRLTTIILISFFIQQEHFAQCDSSLKFHPTLIIKPSLIGINHPFMPSHGLMTEIKLGRRYSLQPGIHRMYEFASCEPGHNNSVCHNTLGGWKGACELRRYFHLNECLWLYGLYASTEIFRLYEQSSVSRYNVFDSPDSTGMPIHSTLESSERTNINSFGGVIRVGYQVTSRKIGIEFFAGIAQFYMIQDTRTSGTTVTSRKFKTEPDGGLRLLICIGDRSAPPIANPERKFTW